MDHIQNNNDDEGPPFSIEAQLAHLNRALAADSLGPAELKWLDENVPLLEMGIYHFKANEWYPLAHALAAQGTRHDLWVACCSDLQFDFPKLFPIPVKLSNPDKVRDLVTHWFYAHLNMDIRPQWDEKNNALLSVTSQRRITPDHVYAVLNAFAAPELIAEVHRGLALNQLFDVKGYDRMFRDSSDTWRFASWILSPDVLGAGPKAVDTFEIPDLDVSPG